MVIGYTSKIPFDFSQNNVNYLFFASVFFRKRFIFAVSQDRKIYTNKSLPNCPCIHNVPDCPVFHFGKIKGHENLHLDEIVKMNSGEKKLIYSFCTYL